MKTPDDTRRPEPDKRRPEPKGHRPESEKGQTWEEAQKERDKEVRRAIDARQRSDRRRPRKRWWGPWLWIRGSAVDMGARPMPDGGVFYASPDIVVESGDPDGNAIAGRPNFVHVLIWNLGRLGAAPVKVDFFWANPALGLGPGHVFPISGETPEYDTIEAKSAKWIKCSTPWIPSFVNNGHECLYVNCDNHILDPIRHPWQPKADRHAGQRNITVLPAPPGGFVNMSLEFNNIFPHRSTAVLAFRAHHLALNFKPEGPGQFNEAVGLLAGYGAPLIRVHPAERPGETPRPLRGERNAPAAADAPHAVREISSGRGAATIKTSIDEGVAIVPYANADEYVAQLFQARASGKTADVPALAELHEVAMRPFEQRHLQLQLGVPAGAKPGEFVAFHIVQKNEGFTLGGYVVVVAVRG